MGSCTRVPEDPTRTWPRVSTLPSPPPPRVNPRREGKFGRWRFDKRTYAGKPPPRHLGEPPKGMKNDMVRALVAAINEASENIPCWDEYARTGVKPKACSEVIAPQADGFRY